MRIKEIEIANLFGMFNYKIPLNLRKRMTIIYGPNGYGKTTILSMIDGIFNGNLYLFFKIPFKYFLIKFDNDKFIKIEKIDNKEDNLHKRKPKSDKLIISMPGREDIIVRDPKFSISRGLKMILRKYGFFLIDPKQTKYIYRPTGELLNFKEIFQKYGYLFEGYDLKLEMKNWYVNFIKEFNIIFINTQRLFVKKDSIDHYQEFPIYYPRIRQNSEDLKKLIQEKITEYAELSQSLDRSFPERLVKLNFSITHNEENIRKKLRYLEEKRKNLMEVGLLDQDSSIVSDIKNYKIDDSTIKVLNVYIEDMEKKLKVFDDLFKKINLFIKIINDRFLNKKFKINKQDGFVIMTQDGREINLEDLSSGEQHEIVIIYEMLFNAKPNFLILIDEPEISFHVEWQEVFLDNLLEIIKLSDLDIVIATHSPQIINDKWDLTVGLE
ncbi:MAG: AAA family ATPase [Promethearchaeota archaeon]